MEEQGMTHQHGDDGGPGQPPNRDLSLDIAAANQPQSEPSQTPEVRVNIQGPDGAVMPADMGDGAQEFQQSPRSRSQDSFLGIDTISDLGFEKHAEASSAVDRGRGALHPQGTYRHRTGSNTSSAHSEGEAETPNTQKGLAKHLRRAICKCKAKDKDAEFIPINEIERILSAENVANTLKDVIPRLLDHESTANLDRLTEEICTSRRRLFALLLLNEHVECIECFVSCGITDRALPFTQMSRDPFELRPRSDGEEQKPVVKCFNGWRDSDFEWLLHKQHCVAVPFFDLSPESLYLYTIPKDSILPFVEWVPAGEGGHSNVWKVSIHPAHHNFLARGRQDGDRVPKHHHFADASTDNVQEEQGHEKQYFAVKSLHTQRLEDYKMEVEVLLRFSGKNAGHPHLIRLLLTYQHEGSYHMVFPWADGNLRDFWESNKTPKRSQALASWLVTQCHGIADGLKEIHGEAQSTSLNTTNKNTGRHGDIKPENILWLKKYNGCENHLLICDFGLSRFHSAKSQSEDKAPGWSPSYRPPECDLYRLRISVKYDIWTLGCLILDFLTWYLLGWEAVDTEFVDARLADEGWVPQPQETTDKVLYEDKFFMQSSTGEIVSANLKPG
ncbi:hypothetical protein OQA88_5206 [Cercophora sp. LCS_1]